MKTIYNQMLVYVMLLAACRLLIRPANPANMLAKSPSYGADAFASYLENSVPVAKISKASERACKYIQKHRTKNAIDVRVDFLWPGPILPGTSVPRRKLAGWWRSGSLYQLQQIRGTAAMEAALHISLACPPTLPPHLSDMLGCIAWGGPPTRSLNEEMCGARPGLSAAAIAALTADRVI
jgi:hypothetical protein